MKREVGARMRTMEMKRATAKRKNLKGLEIARLRKTKGVSQSAGHEGTTACEQHKTVCV